MQQFLIALLYLVVAITSLFLICLVLIQRGKGGGLAGAFGGAGGSSAFGTKAGDVFTKVTMITAGVWIALNMLLVVVSSKPTSAYGTSPSTSKSVTSEVPPAIPSPAKSGTIEIPPAGSSNLQAPAGKTTIDPAAPVSGGAPTAPLPLPDVPKAAPK